MSFLLRYGFGEGAHDKESGLDFEPVGVRVQDHVHFLEALVGLDNENNVGHQVARS